jgi:hypothetical protein
MLILKHYSSICIDELRMMGIRGEEGEGDRQRINHDRQPPG